jgi:hypothetical protein
MSVTPAGTLVIEAAQGLEERLLEEVSIPVGQGVAGWVAQHRRPVCVSRPGDPADVTPSGRSQYRSGTFLSVPLESPRGLLGVLNVTDPVRQKPFDAEDCHLLLVLADRVATAWEQALQLAGTQDGGADAEALRSVLRGMQEGRQRAPNRARLAGAIARRLGLNAAEAGVIGYVSGAPGVEVDGAEVLSGARRLEAEAASDGDRLGPLEVMGAVREMLLARREWWDGSGFPRGLRGDQIPVGARVLAVVDAFASMTARGAEAVNEIRGLAGRQFDPAVVDALLEALPEAELDDDAEPGPAQEGEAETSATRR